MTKTSKQLDFGKEVTPTLNKVFVKLIKESDSYFGDIKKLDTKVETEPYVQVVSIAENVKSVKPGDLAYTRYGLGFNAFKFGDEYYTFINEHDIEGVITESMRQYMKNEKMSQKVKESLS
tara:strand:+ start:48096 stop:48455 length:360 start_codon:yes stop_codon:yes gene_type:complete